MGDHVRRYACFVKISRIHRRDLHRNILAHRFKLLVCRSCVIRIKVHHNADRAAAVHGEYGMLPHDILPELGRMFAEHQR